MGGGKDQKTANKQLEQQAAYQGTQQKAFDTRNTADMDASRARGDELYQSLKGGFQGLYGAGAAGGGGGGTGGGGGGYKAPELDPRYKDVEAQYRNFIETGGWDPTDKGKQQGRIDSLTEIGRTGGVSPEDQARARGLGVYDEFSKTGGYNDRDITNIRSRANSVIPSFYAQAKSGADRLSNVQGGYGPGRSLMMGRLGRDQAANAAATARDTEIGIKENVNKGRQWGASGASSSELALQDMLTRNKLSGLSSANQAQGDMTGQMIGGRQWGTGGLKGLADEEMERRERQAQAAAAASAGGAANERWDREFALKQQAMGLEGLSGLYGSSPEEYMANKKMALASAGSYGGEITTGSQALKTGNKSAWDTVGQIAGSVAGGMTGLGAIGSVAGAGIKAAGNYGVDKYGQPLR